MVPGAGDFNAEDRAECDAAHDILAVVAVSGRATPGVSRAEVGKPPRSLAHAVYRIEFIVYFRLCCRIEGAVDSGACFEPGAGNFILTPLVDRPGRSRENRAAS